MTGDNFNRNARKEIAMFRKCVERLAGILATELRMNKARAKGFAGIIMGGGGRSPGYSTPSFPST